MYHFSVLPLFCRGPGPLPVHSLCRNDCKGTVKTAATSPGLRRGISFSSTEGSSEVDSVDGSEDEVLDGYKKATHGRTPSSVFARLAGNSQICSTLNPGMLSLFSGRPISSNASLRAVDQGDSWRESDFPFVF